MTTKFRVRHRGRPEDEFQVREQHQPKDVASLLHLGLLEQQPGVVDPSPS